MDEGAVMKTRRGITYGSNCKLDIIISEGNREHDMEEPIRINPERLVLSFPMLIVLIYAVSFPIELSAKLNIHN
jgi:hypothetical protein